MNRSLESSEAGDNGFLAPLRNRDFLRLLISNGLWWQAMGVEQVVIGWLALALTDSAWWVALIGFFRSAPMPLAGIFGPVIVERFQRRRVIVTGQSVTFLSIGTVTLLHLHGALAYWHLAAAAMVTGTVWSLDWPTRRSLFPDLLGKSRVVDAMFLDNLLQSVTRVLGPLSAGAVVAVIGTRGALVALTVSAGVSVLVLAGIRTRSRSPQRPGGLADSARRCRDGLRYVFGNRTILGVLLITVAMNLWAFPYMDLLPVFARDILETDAFGLGMLGAASGLGNLGGMLLISWLRKTRSLSWIFATAAMVSCMGLIGFSQSDSLPVSLSILVAVGVGHAGFSVMQSTIILVESSDLMRARAMGTLVIAIGFGPLGRILAGGMAENFGAPVAVGCMAASALSAIAGIAFGLRGFVQRKNPAPRSS